MGFFDKLKKITANLFSGFTEADEAFFAVGARPRLCVVFHNAGGLRKKPFQPKLSPLLP